MNMKGGMIYGSSTKKQENTKHLFLCLSGYVFTERLIIYGGVHPNSKCDCRSRCVDKFRRHLF